MKNDPIMYFIKHNNRPINWAFPITSCEGHDDWKKCQFSINILHFRNPMGVFSKVKFSGKFSMLFFVELIPPFGVTSFVSAVVVCFITFYVFKKLSGDGNVPVRDSKNHSWTSITISSKVSSAYFHLFI